MQKISSKEIEELARLDVKGVTLGIMQEIKT